MRPLLRWLALLGVAFLALQLFFVARIALMVVVDPQSTTFERSEAWRILNSKGALPWRQQWVPYAQISDHLKRAVIASEDDGYTMHDGVDWKALEKAWAKNSRAEEQASRRAAARKGQVANPKVVGGSTITQQLAKNLFLSGERTLLRKGQELVLTMLLEALLGWALLLGALTLAAILRPGFEDRPREPDARDAWRLGGLAALAGMLVQSSFSFVFHLMPGIILLGICLGMMSRSGTPAPHSRGLGSRLLLTLAALGCAATLLPAGWKGSLSRRGRLGPKIRRLPVGPPKNHV